MYNDAYTVVDLNNVYINGFKSMVSAPLFDSQIYSFDKGIIFYM